MSDQITDQIHHQIGSVPVRPDPFPHFIVDGLLDRHLLRLVERHWPAFRFFIPEIKGNHILHFHWDHFWKEISSEQRNFWNYFVNSVCVEIAHATLKAYAGQVERKYGDGIKELQFFWLGLMEADQGFQSHVIHTHHYHDPTYIATNLIYIDDGISKRRGTSLYGAKPGKDGIESLSRIAAQTLKWDDREDLELKTTVEFLPNRLISFLDSPISWHGVEDRTDPASAGPRRIVRMHIGAPCSTMDQIYGVSYDAYRQIRARPDGSPRTLGWMKSDIEAAGYVCDPDRLSRTLANIAKIKVRTTEEPRSGMKRGPAGGADAKMPEELANALTQPESIAVPVHPAGDDTHLVRQACPNRIQYSDQFATFQDLCSNFSHGGSTTDDVRIVQFFYLLEIANRVPGEGSFLECGTFQGCSGRIIWRLMNSSSDLYCFDTFEGFVDEDVKIENATIDSNWKAGFLSNTSIERARAEILKDRTGAAERLHMVKGYLPDAFQPYRHLKWKFVHLDLDLMKPTSDMLNSVWQNVLPGGVVLIHDYNQRGFAAGLATDQFFAPLGITPVPLADQFGSAVIIKSKL